VHHDTYDDYWKSRNLAAHTRNIHCAVLTVGGWFDAEDLQGPFTLFHAIDRDDPEIFNALVVGPWVHGGWARYDGDHLGRASFAANTADYYRKNILFPFFEQYLKGNGNAKLPKAYVFETGTNVWRQYPAWPPKNTETKTLYFHPNGVLSFEPPKDEAAASDEYVSDPAKPVPFVNYVAQEVPQEYMVSDQRFAASRPDVLTYQTEVLQDDVTILGPVSPRLFVSTSGTDSDWDVKLIDVYPPDYPPSKLDEPSLEAKGKPLTDVPAPQFTMGGYEQLVRGEPFRGKFRHSLETPEPFVPGKVEEVSFAMQDVNHTFRRGHLAGENGRRPSKKWIVPSQKAPRDRYDRPRHEYPGSLYYSGPPRANCGGYQTDRFFVFGRSRIFVLDRDCRTDLGAAILLSFRQTGN
jgi:uncharacterized protein